MKLHIYLILILVFPAVIFSQFPPDPVLQFNEKWTNLYSVSYDYQGPGSVRYIAQDPANPNNLCAILMAQQDSSSAAGLQRYIYYSYSDDNGNTWTADVISTTSSQGFPSLSIRNGTTIFSAYQNLYGMRVWEDVIFGGFSLTELYGIPPTPGSSQPVWGKIAGTSNGNIILLTSVIDSNKKAYYNRYSGNNWGNWKSMNHIGSSTGNYTVATGSNGVVGIFGVNSDDDKTIYYYKSYDNGVTFDDGIKIFQRYIENGIDTIYQNSVGGMQAIYNADNTPHLVFTAYGVTNDIFPNPYTTSFISPKILHWSPGTGITVVADKNGISQLADTITNSMVAPLCQPAITFRNNGMLICTFTAYLKGNTQIADNGDVLNAGEIFYTWSYNNGASWFTYPQNLTYTNGIEEKNSSFPVNSYNDINVFYLRDMKAGSWVINSDWGKAPVFGIFRPIIFFQDNPVSNENDNIDLINNFPNPFNPSTQINFTLNNSGFTSLVVYDARGREIAQLVNEVLSEGSYTYSFDTGKYNLPSGVYFYKLTSGENSKVNKMMLVR